MITRYVQAHDLSVPGPDKYRYYRLDIPDGAVETTPVMRTEVQPIDRGRYEIISAPVRIPYSQILSLSYILRSEIRSRSHSRSPEQSRSSVRGRSSDRRRGRSSDRRRGRPVNDMEVRDVDRDDIIGGKKSRKNRNHKTKLETKRRTARKQS